MEKYFITIITFLLVSTVVGQTDGLGRDNSILFVGNSKVGSEGGLHHHFRRTVNTHDSLANLSTHWFSMYNRQTLGEMLTPEVLSRLAGKEDEYVIVQSGSIEEMHKFASAVRDAGSQMLVLGAWADNPFLQGNSLETFYRETRRRTEEWKAFENETGLPVIPCGLIYYDLLVNPLKFYPLRPDYLFVPGSSVQNDLGTIVNVAAIYAAMTGKSPVGLPVWDNFAPELIQLLQERVFNLWHQWKSGTYDWIQTMPPVVPKALTEVSRKRHWKNLIEDGDRILYIGNSFIGTEGGLENHFPRLLREIDPGLELETKSMIFWGQGLARMWTDEVQEEISNGQYDLVIVTSGPTEILQQFREIIEAAGSKMAIHMTWGRNPTINDAGMQGFKRQTEDIVEKMEQFEAETGVPVIPCGLIYYDLVANPPPDFNLRPDWPFMVENIHQNHLGTMANAAAHYAVLTGRSPVGLPMWDPYPRSLIEALQERTWEVVEEWKNR
ncbi:MAG: hypothetical protein KDC80_29570 [Saprospiraceae bacterium]|nr:hypothetical protein [Saprospiraceae bacterium]